MAGGRTRFYHGIEIPHFTESGHSRCHLFFLPAIWIPNIQVRYKAFMCIYSGTGRELRGGSRGGSLGSDEPPLLLTALKNKAY